MLLTLPNDDYERIRILRKSGVLENVKTHQIQAKRGFMVLMCSDCDQLNDKIGFLRRISKKKRELKRVHLFALNGGGTLLSPSSETRTGGEQDILLNHIHAAIRMKKIDTLISKCHAPCGAARAHDLNFYQVLHRMFEGKLYAKQEVPELLHVACFVQIDYGSRRPWWMFWKRRKATYAVTYHKWREFVEARKITL